MEINIENLQTKLRLDPPRISKIIRRILKHEHISTAALSFVFVSRQKIAALNKKYLGRTYATDVLAFDLTNQESPKPSRTKDRILCGDVIISTDAVVKNAVEFETSSAHELVLYVIHGMLHLIGYDDHKPADIKKMRAKEQELMKVVNKDIKNVIRS